MYTQAMASQMPDTFRIGTKKAFENKYSFLYTKKQVGSEILYICTKGSEWARTHEQLVLRYDAASAAWTAFDSDVNNDGTTLQCRQAVFRCKKGDITQPGWYEWETNWNATNNDDGLETKWQGELWAETKVP